jgi:fibronectin type 3 domain-containing protein
VCERYGLLEAKYKKTVSNKLKQSGINTEPTEFDLAMEDIVSQFESQEETALKAKEA